MPMFLALASWSAANSAVIIAASITAVGAIVASVIAFVRTRRTPKVKPARPDVSPSPLAEFSGTQNEFTQLVMKDNADLRTQLGALAADVAEIKATQADERKAANSYRGAMRRYLQKIQNAWRGPAPMPLPDDADFDLLSQTLPNFARPKN